MSEIGFIKAFGISYVGTIPKIKKATDQLQPIFEAFTNSLESIRILNQKDDVRTITIKLCHRNDLFSKEEKGFDFESIVIEDSGIGFNNDEFERIENLNDTSKAFFNKGSGRIQFLHFFDKSEYKSVYADPSSSTGFKERNFTLSKSDAFLKNNAIIRLDKMNEVNAVDQLTTLTFKGILTEKDQEFYKQLNLEELKEKLIIRYLALFCENRDSLPDIRLQYFVDSEMTNETSIESKDIPKVDKQTDVNIHYQGLTTDGKTIVELPSFETFNLKAFKIDKDQLLKNGLKLTSKGEIAQEIKLEALLPDDYIGDARYLFLISGDYLNKKDGDTRGRLSIPTADEFKKIYGDSTSLYNEEEILLDDIQDKANDVILSLYNEINDKTKEKKGEIDKLKKMFLLSSESLKEAKIKLNDSDEKILEKVYQADAKLIAKKDAEIKNRVDALDHLNPIDPKFEELFEKEVEALSIAIPLQNRATLTHYVGRRKLVLQLFRKILDRQLDVQNLDERKFDEKLLHNLLFQQGSNDPEKSDLWIIKEDFIYFKGTSETRLIDIKINGKNLFKNKFSEQENNYLVSLGENRKIKRPDILLFPEEGKCIIIEFKDPMVNASEHLTQIDYYASLIRNFTIDEIQITSFYGYLIGEHIDPRDVRGRVGGYEYSYHFDFLFRPSQKVVGDLGDVKRDDGSIYSEVIKYSSLIARAEKRNSIFINKL